MSQLSHQSREHPSDAHAYSHPRSPHQPSQRPHHLVHDQSHTRLQPQPQPQPQHHLQNHHHQYQSQSQPAPGPPYTPVSPTSASQLDHAQDSPTIGRAQVHHFRGPHSGPVPSPITIVPLGGVHASGSGSGSGSGAGSDSASGSGTLTSSAPTSPLPSAGPRFRKPAPSPLHNTTAISPPNSPSPRKAHFQVSFGAHGSPINSPTTPLVSQTTNAPQAAESLPRQRTGESIEAEKSYYHSDSSGTATPDDKTTPGSSLPLRFAHDNRSVSDPVKKPLGASTNSSSQAMPGSSRMEKVKGAPRNSSIDSAISAISTGSSTPKNSQDGSSSPADISKLIKAAGSPEAVIQYLLKEKNSQTQQNSQLWRLVDKQRAMILGLNKDLERALKDKEKYRKKLKEVMTLQTIPSVSSASAVQGRESVASLGPADDDDDTAKKSSPDAPASPSVESENMRHSPIDVSMAPYPITPPADQCSNGPPSAVGEILDPSHAMPEASEHALDNFDHDAQERAAEESKGLASSSNDIPINFALPPSRSLPERPPPPQGALPAPPRQAPRSELDVFADEDGTSRFPAVPAPPPRKPPPAPLQLKEQESGPPAYPPDEESESDSDYDDILEVDEIAAKRGRRRTRQEDDELREVLVLKEAEARSISKKSKNSAKGAPEAPTPEINLAQSSPRALNRANAPGSLAGMLDNNMSSTALPLRSPGLPLSPRPMQLGEGPNSPPQSPRQHGLAVPLSPRAPRQAIPLPPNTPLQTPPSEPLALKSPQPLNIVKTTVDAEAADSPTSESRASQADRTRIFKGFVTEEFPELLLPPNAIPSVIVKVASSRMKPSRASLISLTQLEEDPVFTLAIISRYEGGELWRVEKDSMSLAKLDQRLKQCAAFTARTPDRTLFSGHAPAKLDARRQALDQYLDEALNTPFDTPSAVELCKYLSTNVLPPNADEVGSSTGPSDEGGPRLGPGGRQFKTGYLTKRGKNFGGWKARFFSVEGPQLKYFETPGGAHLGTIKLPGAQIGRQSQQGGDAPSPSRPTDEVENQYRHAFLILEPKKKDPSAMTKHVLCAESDKERDQWVEVLLQWTNFKEVDEDNKRDHAQDRQGSGHVKSANAKKKMHPRPQQQQSKDGEDALIGVSYEATKQGDVPKMGSHDHPQPSPAAGMGTQPSYSISAPRDPQVISDMSMWGNKMGGLNVPPGLDEKKAKKRSFFGFGPKQRSSSDGTDSLFGESSGSPGASAGSREVYSGPVRRTFGAPLAEAVRYNSPRDIRVPLPAVVYRCIQYLEAKGAITEEGIFRLSGSNIVIKSLKERFDNEGDVNLLADEQYHDIHAVASMLKAYLRELPTSILTRDLHLDFVAVTEMSSQAEKIVALSELVTRLPQVNATLLKYLIAFLIKVINHSDRNKMTVRNVGIVFSPTLTIPAPVFALFLQNYEAIFGIVPEEYELPTPGSFEEQRGRDPALDLPPRPSTSGAARESPHRHRLAEALQEGRRGNTPPPAGLNPLGGFTQARSTPTPPLIQQRTYEPSYLAQQNAGGANVHMRPAYESMLMTPGPDANQFYAAQQRMVNPGYDRPIYETGAAYDQPQSVRASRRESTMMMMGGVPRGLTPQSSMGRLREDPQF